MTRKITFNFIIFLIAITAKGQGLWQAHTAFGGKARSFAAAFTINGKIYCGNGTTGTLHAQKDFWCYDPATDSWTQKANFGGAARWGSAVFTIGNKAYVCAGRDSLTSYNDLWEYDAANDQWNQRADFPSTPRRGATAFVINNKAYVGLGWDGGTIFGDFAEYNPTTDTWKFISSYPLNGCHYPVSFVIGNAAYIGTGFNANGYSTSFCKYIPATDVWSITSDINGGRNNAVAFTQNGYGFVCGGYDGNDLKDVQKFDPTNQSWTNYGDMPYRNQNASCTMLNGTAYVICGDSSSVAPNRRNLSFDYIDLNSNFQSGLQLCPKANFIVDYTTNKAFQSGNEFKVELSDENGVFGTTPSYIGNTSATNSGSISCVIPSNLVASNGYLIRVVGTNPAMIGYTSPTSLTLKAAPKTNTTLLGDTGLCPGDSLRISVPSVVSSQYQWLKDGAPMAGKNSYSGYVNTSGSYRIIVSASNGCVDTSTAVNVSVLTGVSNILNTSGNTTFCEGDSVILSSSKLPGFQYIWRKDGAIIQGATDFKYTATQSGKYKLTLSNGKNCNLSTNETSVTVNPAPLATIKSPLDSASGCQGIGINIIADSTQGNIYQWYKDQQLISGATNSIYASTTSGQYAVKVTNTTNNCSKLSKNIKINFIQNTNPGNIIGLNSVIQLSTQNYSVSQSTGITFNWLASGGNIISGQGSNVASIQWGYHGPGMVKVYASPGCTDTSSLYVGINWAQGISNANVQNFNIYPNPTSNVINLPNIENAVYKIMSIDGRIIDFKLTKSKDNILQADVSWLSSGMYIIQIYSDNKILTSSFIKE